jgi:hypothetical protein
MRSNLLAAAIALMFATAPVLAEGTSERDNQPPPLVQGDRVSNLRTLSLAEMDGVKGGFFDSCFVCSGPIVTQNPTNNASSASGVSD